MKDFQKDHRPANEQPRQFLSLVLTVIVHIGLLALLFFGINWQSKPLGTLEVGLVGPSSPAPKPPRPEPPPEPPKPEPPKPEPPKPVAEEPAPQPKPEIATKKEKPKKPPEKPKEPPKPEKPKPEKPRELKQIDLNRTLEKEIARSAETQKANDLLNGPRGAAAASPGELDAYRAAVAAKIRRNLVAPPDLSGNPEAMFEIEQLLGNGGGEVVNVKLKHSSGNRALDEAIVRAIRKSSPLPLPENRNLFERKLNLTFRPLGE
ncbi:MAG: TonB C-terminal domain-containing protein [Azoarcus sp.]|jgi:colicin import membrane protein|nr:TonB C-terminal domain-containing protein [Azoarcus sp.]